MKIYTQEEMLDMSLGPVGTPERDQFEAELRVDLESSALGQTICEQRLSQHLTQAQLGEKAGVTESLVAKAERGCDVSYKAINRIFKALGFQSGHLDLGSLGRVALW